MKHTDITKAIYNNEEVQALYLGDLLIYQRAQEEQPPTYGPYQLVGKFLDNSTPENWWYKSGYFSFTAAQHSINGPTFNEEVIDFKDRIFSFQDNTKLERIDHLPSINVSDWGSMFSGCSSLLSVDLAGLDSSIVTGMSSMFSNCNALKSINFAGANTSKVTSMRYMFSDCRSLQFLDVSGFNTSKVTDMYGMFRGCRNLKNLDVSGFDVSNVTDMYGIFFSCENLQTLNIAGWDFSNLAEMYIFEGNLGLTDVIGPVYGIQASINLSYIPLTNQSAMVFIDGLAEVSTTKTIRFSPAQYDELSEEQIATATAKGWTVARNA